MGRFCCLLSEGITLKLERRSTHCIRVLRFWRSLASKCDGCILVKVGYHERSKLIELLSLLL